MISSQTRQYISGFDEIIEDSSEDFEQSGVKVTSVIRVGRLAVVSDKILLGAFGEISCERLKRVKKNLSNWLSE
jgi:mRNA interferase MazF